MQKAFSHLDMEGNRHGKWEEDWKTEGESQQMHLTQHPQQTPGEVITKHSLLGPCGMKNKEARRGGSHL
jgi:hypothetical protein